MKHATMQRMERQLYDLFRLWGEPHEFDSLEEWLYKNRDRIGEGVPSNVKRYFDKIRDHARSRQASKTQSWHSGRVAARRKAPGHQGRIP